MSDAAQYSWRFEDTGQRPGVFNMAHDVALAHDLAAGSGRPTLRLYGWNPHAISLGWNQSMEEIDADRARSEGIDVVRRPTGGRAILHSDEVTYSVVMHVRDRNILAVYDDISKGLLQGLRRLGADVAIEKAQPHFPSLYKTASAVACFSSSARYEIKHQGRKLVGSAQRRYAAADGGDVVLQHGSILLGNDHLRMTELLVLPDDEARTALRRELEERTTDLAAVLGRRVGYKEAVEALRVGFMEHWGITFAQPDPESILERNTA